MSIYICVLINLYMYLYIHNICMLYTTAEAVQEPKTWKTLFKMLTMAKTQVILNISRRSKTAMCTRTVRSR